MARILSEAAPLLATADAPVPDGGGAEWFTGAGGAKLRAALFPADGEARGSVVLSPGRTEPIEKYFEVVERLRARGLTVLVHDWRGHGLSLRSGPDQRGHASGGNAFMTDFAALIAAFEPRLPRPWTALGHSMGGCLTLLALARGERRFAAAVLSAPMLGIDTGRVPREAAHLLARGLTLVGLGAGLTSAAAPPEPFEANVLTHDPARYRRNIGQLIAWPQLRVGPPTWGWLDFAFRANAELESGAGARAIETPITIVLAGDERLVDNAAARRIAGRLRHADLSVVDGAYHELMQETDALQSGFWRAFDARIA